MLKEQLKEEQLWFFDGIKRNTILSDDIDSLFSCCLLEQYKGWKIEKFYSFDKTYRLRYTKRELVGIDIALNEGKTIDNHLTRNTYKCAYNKESINLNICNNISCQNYAEKYAGSTLLEVLSLLEIDVDKFNEEQKMVIMAIDSSYAGYYRGFRKWTYEYIKNQLELDSLYNLLSRHTESEFEKIKKKYGLKGKIYVYKNKLSTDIELDLLNELFKDTGIVLKLPKEVVYKEKEYQGTKHKNGFERVITDKYFKHIYSMAFTYKNNLSYTKY